MNDFDSRKIQLENDLLMRQLVSSVSGKGKKLPNDEQLEMMRKLLNEGNREKFFKISEELKSAKTQEDTINQAEA